MSALKPQDFAQMYHQFQSPIAALDCGAKCSPYNEHGVPFCCDTRHAVPAAYEAEWDYLQSSTDLWHAWQSSDPEITADLQSQTPTGIVLIECLGARLCQRGYRAISCLSFPFFPYLTRSGEFIGLSYYWEYEDRCWVISNLGIVTPAFVRECIEAYEMVFAANRDERDAYLRLSADMRRVFARRNAIIPIVGRDGAYFAIEPRTHALRPASTAEFPAFGPYRNEEAAAAAAD